MKRFLGSLFLAASSALIIPLSLIPDSAKLCQPNGVGGYMQYSVQRPDLHGVTQTLAFNKQAQTGFCRVLAD